MTDNGTTHDIPENERPRAEEADIAAEFAELGRKLRDAIDTAWHSEERHRVEKDIRDGLNRFAAEMNEAAKNFRESDLGQRVETRTQEVVKDVERGKVAEDVRKGMLKALRGLSEALDQMADSFTPAGESDTPKK